LRLMLLQLKLLELRKKRNLSVKDFLNLELKNRIRKPRDLQKKQLKRRGN